MSDFDKKAYRAAHYRANKARHFEQVAAWRRANPEAVAAIARRSQIKHASRVSARSAKYRASRGQAQAAWADTALIADIYEYAAIMRAHGVDCHVDHEVPLNGKLVSGLHTHGNLTVLLALDNMRKGNREVQLEDQP